jgi:peptide/nickel transport system substrate-binding protein
MRRAGFWLVVALAAVFAVTGCGGSSNSAGGTGTGGKVVQGGILRVGTTNYIDTLNPFNYIEAQAANAYNMIFPQLVQYDYADGKYTIVPDFAESWDTSADGKTWTFHLRSGGKWSDGQPITAEDAAWTLNTTLKYQKTATAVLAGTVAHVDNAEATDPSTLVIHYKDPVGNVLAALEQGWILPEHAWKKFAVGDGKGLKTYQPEQSLPMVTGGPYTIKSYEKKGTTVFIKDPNFYGPKSNADAVALTFYTNADAMITDLKGGQLDYVDQVPFSAVDVVKKDSNIQVDTVPGFETTNITWNSNPRKPKNRELLDPQVKKALSMCVDRDKIIDVVFSGYAEKVENIVGNVAMYANTDLGPLEYNCDAANQMLDQLGYEKGADGIRVAPATSGQYAQPAHKMQYEIIIPNSLDFNGDREFEIVQQGFAQLGVKVTEKPGGDSSAAYALETGDNCDVAKSTGYDSFDIAMWDWIGYVDPDFQLSVVTKAQWCYWSDTGWDNPEYDKLYAKQATLVDANEREQLVKDMQKTIYDNFLYTQLVEEQAIDAHRKEWDGFKTAALNAYSKTYYTAPHKVG